MRFCTDTLKIKKIKNIRKSKINEKQKYKKIKTKVK